MGNEESFFQELGPLGDAKIAATRFSRLGGCIQELFPLDDLIVSKRKIKFTSLRSDDGELDTHFDLFKTILA